MTKEQKENLVRANDTLLSVYWDIRDQRGDSAAAKRLDTILAKLYDLICIEDKKQAGRR